jgi:hypothetical protein
MRTLPNLAIFLAPKTATSGGCEKMKMRIGSGSENRLLPRQMCDASSFIVDVCVPGGFRPPIDTCW